MESEDLSWDKRKARVNKAKHGISFVEAVSALDDPLVRFWADVAHGEPDARFNVVGMDFRGRLLFLVVEEAPGGTIRLISARRATKREQHAYTTGIR